ncbi:hypothetical protein V070_01872 [Staphylococcus aureus C0673]|nr:hypothetical protein V070_01872 [Staphylococcus aureus C0673]
MLKFDKKKNSFLKWFLFTLQMILAILLAVFAYKQMNQDHLDTSFTIFTVLFLIFVFWNTKHYHTD